jgi:DNA-binding LytR/AlgR family response regulator
MVTAFDQHAIAAFDAGAVDYLLKPVRAQRLKLAVERALRVRNGSGVIAQGRETLAASSSPAPFAGRRKVVAKDGAEYALLDLAEILAFEAEGELVWIVTSDQRLLATQSLRGIEKKLTGPQFRRVHRNAIVNLDHVRKICSLSSQRWLLTLSNSEQLTVSKRQAHIIRKTLRG